MKDRVNILGTEYRIEKRKYEDDSWFEKYHFQAYCEPITRLIVIGDLSSYERWDNGEINDAVERHLLRHEIVHAFFGESGLDCQSNTVEDGWAVNEEMVDWIARQGEKIYKAWQEAECLG